MGKEVSNIMIIIIISLCAAILFPWSLIKAIRSDEDTKFYSIVCCVSFLTMFSVIIYMLKFLINNLI